MFGRLYTTPGRSGHPKGGRRSTQAHTSPCLAFCTLCSAPAPQAGRSVQLLGNENHGLLESCFIPLAFATSSKAVEVLVHSTGLLFAVQFDHFIGVSVQTHGYEQRQPQCLCRKPGSFKNEHGNLCKPLRARVCLCDCAFVSQRSCKGGLTCRHIGQTPGCEYLKVFYHFIRMPYLTRAQEAGPPRDGRVTSTPSAAPTCKPAASDRCWDPCGEERPVPAGAITLRQAAVCVKTCSSVNTGANTVL